MQFRGSVRLLGEFIPVSDCAVSCVRSSGPDTKVLTDSQKREKSAQNVDCKA